MSETKRHLSLIFHNSEAKIWQRTPYKSLPLVIISTNISLPKAMKMIHLGKCTTLVKMESVPPINLRKYVLGKSSTPPKKW